MEFFTNKLKQAAMVAFIALVIWFAWPALQPQLAAVWAQVMNQRGQSVDTVPAPAVIVVTPTLAPQVQPAVVQPAVVATTAPVITNDVQPAPVIQPAVPVVPTPALADQIVTIEAAGRVWHLTSERLADCAAAQAAGQRTGMACPPNAAKYAGVPGAPGVPSVPGAPAQALYSQFNGRLAYCLAGSGWTPEYSQTLAAAFDAWSGSGVIFSPVDVGTSCQLPVSLVYNPSSAYAGRASEGPIGAWLAMNTYYGFDVLVAMHEIGHVLGLGHWPSGVMTADGYYTAPGAAELAAVAALWGGGGR